MGRLDDIEKRNAKANRDSRNRVIWVVAIAALVVTSVLLATYSEIGQPAKPKRDEAWGIELRQTRPRPSASQSGSAGSGSQNVGSGASVSQP